jgi:hypothetical protein
VKTQASFLFPTAGMDFQDEMTASTSYGGPTIASPPCNALTSPLCTSAAPLELDAAPKLPGLVVGGCSPVGSDKMGKSLAAGYSPELVLVSGSSEKPHAPVSQSSAELPGPELDLVSASLVPDVLMCL